MRLPTSADVLLKPACSIACRLPAVAVTLCKLTHGMHSAAGTLCLILLAASDPMLSDMQVTVHGVSVQE